VNEPVSNSTLCAEYPRSSMLNVPPGEHSMHASARSKDAVGQSSAWGEYRKVSTAEKQPDSFPRDAAGLCW
jgi:hypothetical protein